MRPPARRPSGFLVTRPQPGANETAARLHAHGLKTLVAPLFDMHLLPTPPPAAKTQFDALVLTSASGVRAFLARADWPRFKALPVWCVGQSTRQLAEAAGHEIAGQGANLEELAARLHAVAALRLLYPGARNLGGDLSALLEGTGHTVAPWPIYAMNPVIALPGPVIAALDSGEVGAVLIYSKRAASTFVGLSGAARLDLTGLTALCLSRAVAAHLPAATFAGRLAADAPDEPSMIELAGAFANGQIGT